MGTLINIDHHISNEGYGDLNYVDPTAPATGQIIYEFFKEIGALAFFRYGGKPLCRHFDRHRLISVSGNGCPDL